MTGNVPAPGPWLDMQEASEYLRVSLRTIKRLVGERRVPSYQPSDNRTLLNRKELDAYVEGTRRNAI